MKLPTIRVQIRYHAADEADEKQSCVVRVSRIAPCADAADAIRDKPRMAQSPGLVAAHNDYEPHTMIMTSVVEIDPRGGKHYEMLTSPVMVLPVGFERAA